MCQVWAGTRSRNRVSDTKPRPAVFSPPGRRLPPGRGAGRTVGGQGRGARSPPTGRAAGRGPTRQRPDRRRTRDPEARVLSSVASFYKNSFSYNSIILNEILITSIWLYTPCPQPDMRGGGPPRDAFRPTQPVPASARCPAQAKRRHGAGLPTSPCRTAACGGKRRSKA